MKILITGGGGFIGSRLARALRARDPSAQITLLDVAFPPGHGARFHCVAGDVAAPEVIGRAMDSDTAAIFHLAAVVSGGAEADFDLGYHVNMDGTHALLEAARKLAKPPRSCTRARWRPSAARCPRCSTIRPRPRRRLPTGRRR